MFAILMAFALSAPPAATDAEIVVMSHEPTPPDRSEQTFVARCGNRRLQIGGYGAARPRGRPVSLVANGREVSGAELLRRDLANPDAVYRIAAGCSQIAPQITVSIAVLGRIRGSEDVAVHVARATFRGADLEHYSGLQRGQLADFAY